MTRRALGRGLEALIPTRPATLEAPPPIQSDEQARAQYEVDIDRIRPTAALARLLTSGSARRSRASGPEAYEAARLRCLRGLRVKSFWQAVQSCVDGQARPVGCQRIASVTEMNVIGPRFSARTGASMVLRSPTITTANLSGWRYFLAAASACSGVTAWIFWT